MQGIPHPQTPQLTLSQEASTRVMLLWRASSVGRISESPPYSVPSHCRRLWQPIAYTEGALSTQRPTPSPVSTMWSCS